MGYASDIESLGLIGGGAQGFIKGWQDAEDRKQKKMELDSKLQTDQEARQRAQVQQAIQLKQSGLAQNQSDPTKLEDAPLTARQIGEQDVQAAEKGMTLKHDPTTGNTTGHSWDENSPVMIGARSKATVAGAKVEALDHKNDVKPKEWTTFNQELDPNRARTGNLGNTQKRINSADNLKTLFDQFPDNNIPKSQSVELATGIAGLINGGSPQSQQQIHDLVPSSAAGSAEDTVSWFFNNPTGRQQQAFIQGLKGTMERERAMAVMQLRTAQKQKLAGFEHLQAADPERYQRVLHNWHLDEEDPKPPAAQPQGIVDQPKPGLLGMIRGMMSGGANASSTQPAKPTTIIQNGHTYTLNPKTGGYE